MTPAKSRNASPIWTPFAAEFEFPDKAFVSAGATFHGGKRGADFTLGLKKTEHKNGIAQDSLGQHPTACRRSCRVGRE